MLVLSSCKVQEDSHQILSRHLLSSWFKRIADSLQKDDVEARGWVWGLKDVDLAGIFRICALRIPGQDRQRALIYCGAEVSVASRYHQSLYGLEVAVDPSFPGDVVTTVLFRHFDHKWRHFVRAWRHDPQRIHGAPLGIFLFEARFDVNIACLGVMSAYAGLQALIQLNFEVDIADGPGSVGRRRERWKRRIGIEHAADKFRIKRNLPTKVDGHRNSIVVSSKAVNADGFDTPKTLRVSRSRERWVSIRELLRRVELTSSRLLLCVDEDIERARGSEWAKWR